MGGRGGGDGFKLSYLKGGGGIGVSHQVVTKGKSKSGCGGYNQFRYFVICFQVPR